MSTSYVRCKHVETEEIENVEIGFSITAFFFPALWSFFHKFWGIGIVVSVMHFVILLAIGDGYVFGGRGISGEDGIIFYSVLIIYSFFSIYLGVNGYKLILKRLVKKGFVLEKIVSFYQIVSKR